MLELLFSLLIGILSGFVLFLLGLLFLYYKGNKNISIFNPEVEEIDKDILKEIIESKKINFKDSEKHNLEDKSSFKILGENLLEMTEEISKLYYPSSDYAPYEMTLEEVLMLNSHFLEMADKILDTAFIKKIRNMKLVYILEKSKEKEQEETVKKSFISKINPINIAKSYVVGTAIKKGTTFICLKAINILGNELPKIYSKGLFKENIVIDEEEVEYE